MQIALLSLASIWAMYLTLLSILAMPGTKGIWTKRPETLSFWVFLTRPLLQIHLHPVSCDHSRIESSLGTLRWRESQPPEVTAGIKMADTQSCTYWLSAAVGRLSFSQVRSEIQLVSFYLFMRFWYRRTSKKGPPVVVWFPGFVILVIFLQMTALEPS